MPAHPEALKLRHPPATPSPAPVALAIDPAALRPIISAAVAEVLAQTATQAARIPADAICFTEEEAARLLRLEPHVLRDERLRGRIDASQIVGRRVRYTRADLLAYLQARRVR